MQSNRQSETNLRLAELLASLSLAIDLGIGKPMEWVLSSCLLGVALSEMLGLGEADRQDVYYLSLLRHIGCTATADDEAALFGNELHMADALTVDSQDLGQAFRFLLRTAGRGQPLVRRAQFLAKALAAGPAAADTVAAVQCEIAAHMASTLDLRSDYPTFLWQIYERWDGRGVPNRLEGAAIALPVRVIHVAQDAVTVYQLGGLDAALAFVRERAGRILDPAIVDQFSRSAPELLERLKVDSLWQAVLEAEPGDPVRFNDEQFEIALQVIADFTDLKSPYTINHSRGVADLAARTAQQFGLPETDVRALRWMGYIHDIGRVGVSAGIWGKAGPLTESEWERVRLHPYYTERVFARSPSLADIGAQAALHHERLDGSGYHRRLSAGMLPIAARILAAADVYHAMTEPRPHRPALASATAATELRREVQAGLLDSQVADAVLSVAGHQLPPARRGPATELSQREIEVLRLVARGLTNKEVAKVLVISPRTVEHHLQHIYDKTGASSRAGATLFAMQHHLIS
ncbi:MAG TPA: HD domain-containing phosphohydrolase [Roseiflexaceae bacterium]|jgi:HD-GYP domain-containing protein (c-di-GMP phosphodiesterase class II)